MAGDTQPVGRTKHGEFTLDQIAETLPGMARLMVEVSDRYWILYYAAQGGNWQLAHHELNELRKALKMAAVTRPKYKESLERYDADYMSPLNDAVHAKDWPAVERAYVRATDNANDLHREFGYSYIEWKLPETPPGHLRLTE